MMFSNQNGKTCACPHHKMMPLLVVLFGVLFLGENFGLWSSSVVETGWPMIVIVVGFMKLGSGMCKCCGTE